MKAEEKEIQPSFTPHWFLEHHTLNRFIRKSDNKLIQAKYSTYGNDLVYVVERDIDDSVFLSVIRTIEEFNDGYMTEEGWETFK